MKNLILAALCILFLFNSCKKAGTPENTVPASCVTLTSVKATANTLTATQGTKFVYSCSPVFAGSTTGAVTYSWTIPGEIGRTTASDSLTNIDYRNAGWWYVEAKNTCDGVIKKDSFQLTVIPSCYNSVTNNIFNFTVFLTGTATFSNTKQKDSVLNYSSSEVYFGIQADQHFDPVSLAYGAIALAFHPQYKSGNLPPSGAYTTTTINANGRPVFSAGDVTKCYISYVCYNTTAGNVIYRTDPNQTIYISNVNGKLKAVLCGVAFTGTSSLTGLTYHPVATGALAVP
jgi:hypothetical protein